MIMKKTIAKYFIWVMLVIFSSCKMDGLQDNPNYLSQDQADINFLVNGIEVEFGTNFFDDASGPGMDLTRMRALISGANYNAAYRPVDFDAMWESFYSSLLPDIATTIRLGEASGLYTHVAVAKFIKAYALVTMVDYFGDIPYSQAGDPTNFNPVSDKGSALYDSALIILDQAIEDFGKSSPNVPGDLFHGNASMSVPVDPGLWVTAANTLKLKINLQKRLVDPNAKTEIAKLLTAPIDLIDDPKGSEDFAFQYPGNSIANPDTRHPFFTDSYINGAGAYMSNSYMYAMYVGEGGIQDPRIRYYFYRQSDEQGTDVNLLSCYGVPAPAHYPSGTIWCQGPDGYWGRDHLNNDGTGPDNRKRTAYGLYPGGGKFDADDGVQTTVNDGNKGKGMSPILMSSFTYFMRAEAALTLGTGENPLEMLMNGVDASIQTVKIFGESSADPDFVPSDSDIKDYEDAVSQSYINAPDKLQVVMEQYLIALWGNGIEAYNSYRRTGYPNNLQPARNPQPGDFYRSMSYPNDFISRNQNAKQHAVGTQVFWDVNPAGFVK
jgi:hypothetical protein